MSFLNAALSHCSLWQFVIDQADHILNLHNLILSLARKSRQLEPPRHVRVNGAMPKTSQKAMVIASNAADTAIDFFRPKNFPKECPWSGRRRLIEENAVSNARLLQFVCCHDHDPAHTYGSRARPPSVNSRWCDG